MSKYIDSGPIFYVEVKNKISDTHRFCKKSRFVTQDLLKNAEIQ